MNRQIHRIWNRFAKKSERPLSKLIQSPSLFTGVLLGGAAGVTLFRQGTKKTAISDSRSLRATPRIPTAPIPRPIPAVLVPEKRSQDEKEKAEKSKQPSSLWSLAGVKSLVFETFNEWSEDRAPRLGAALAYYTAFSLAPILVVVIAVAGLAYGQEAVQNRVMSEVKTLIGPESGEAVQAMLQAAREPARGIVATVIGIFTLLLGATGVFVELQDALNTIWDATRKQASGIMAMIRQRFISFAMIVGIGFLLLVSLVVSATLTGFGEYVENAIGLPSIVMTTLNFLVSFGVITLMFALIYKIIPDTEIGWGDVWIGAAVTALLFTIGKYLIGLYIAQSTVGSAFGAAGSLVVILVWVYYSTQIVFLGAEFTQVYARKHGSHMIKNSDAMAAQH